MHEIGVLTEAINQIHEIAKKNKVDRVKVVTLQIGEASGYLTHFFTEYFPFVTKDIPLFEGCQLRMIVTKAEALCLNCHSLYNVMTNKGKCPKCNSREKQMIGGQEFLIKEIIY